MDLAYKQGVISAATKFAAEKLAVDPIVLSLLGAALGGGATALSMPGIRKSVEASLKAMGKGGAKAVERQSALPAGAVSQARQLAAALREKGISPKRSRIAIVGTGGTGKTTMGRALAAELNMPHMIMDDYGRDYIKGRDYVKYTRKNPIPEGTIAEQTHLLTQLDPDQFDAVVYLRKPIEDVKKQIRKRGRGAWQTDLYRYEDIDKSLAKGFETLQSPTIEISPTLRAKVRQSGTYGSEKALEAELRKSGINPKGMTREKKVLSAAMDKKVSLPGILPYLDKERLAILGLGAGGGAALANYLGSDSEE